MNNANKSIIRIIILFALLILFSFTLLGSTYAWFVGVKRTGNLRFRYGNIDYEMISVSLKPSTDVIKPGDNILLDNQVITLVNHSSVESEIRVKVSIIVDGVETILTTDPNQLYYVHLQEYSVDGTVISKWEYMDGYYYYTYNTLDLLHPTFLPKSSTDEARNDLLFIDEIRLNGNLMGNSFDNKELTIKLVFQAKQANNVTWDQLGETDFTIN